MVLQSAPWTGGVDVWRRRPARRLFEAKAAPYLPLDHYPSSNYRQFLALREFRGISNSNSVKVWSCDCGADRAEGRTWPPHLVVYDGNGHAQEF
jgi:hypothetical protein